MMGNEVGGLVSIAVLQTVPPSRPPSTPTPNPIAPVVATVWLMGVNGLVVTVPVVARVLSMSVGALLISTNSGTKVACRNDVPNPLLNVTITSARTGDPDTRPTTA